MRESNQSNVYENEENPTKNDKTNEIKIIDNRKKLSHAKMEKVNSTKNINKENDKYNYPIKKKGKEEEENIFNLVN